MVCSVHTGGPSGPCPMLAVPWNRGGECPERGGGESHSSLLICRNRTNTTRMPRAVPQRHLAALSPARQSRRFCPRGGFPVSRWGGGYGHRLPESLENNAVIAGVLPAVELALAPHHSELPPVPSPACDQEAFLGTLLFCEVPRGMHKYEAVSAARLPTVRWREEQD